MRVYEGKRTIDGLVVTVDGKPLPEHYEVKRFAKYGFEWTYEGESPRELALGELVAAADEAESPADIDAHRISRVAGVADRANMPLSIQQNQCLKRSQKRPC